MNNVWTSQWTTNLLLPPAWNTWDKHRVEKKNILIWWSACFGIRPHSLHILVNVIGLYKSCCLCANMPSLSDHWKNHHISNNHWSNHSGSCHIRNNCWTNCQRNHNIYDNFSCRFDAQRLCEVSRNIQKGAGWGRNQREVELRTLGSDERLQRRLSYISCSCLLVKAFEYVTRLKARRRSVIMCITVPWGDWWRVWWVKVWHQRIG